jgi:hypothetical protein
MVMAVSEDLTDTATVYVELGTGTYQTGPLLPGNWEVTALAPGYASQTVSGVGVVAGEISGPVDFTLLEATP